MNIGGNAADADKAVDLRHFFAPRSLALVGASDDVRKFGGRVLKRMTDFGFAGKIYPVNPKAKTIFRMPAFPSVSSLPEVPDHVGVAVPAKFVIDVLEECAAVGVPFATVFTSGFAEAGSEEGVKLQAEITAIARRTGMRIMGPNCNGLVSFVNRLVMSTTGALIGEACRPGNVGIIAQSGGLGQVNVMYRALELGIGISHEVSCGNQADLDALDFVEFMVEDPSTDVILVAVEGIGDGEKLRRVAGLAARARKPIVILKLGRSEAGRAAVASHTGAVTGSDDVHSAAFRQFGLIRVEDCPQLNEVAMLLRAGRLPKGRRAAAVAASGGHAVLTADLGGSMGITWTDYTEETQRRLNDIVPDFGQVSNPTDLTTAATGAQGMFADAIAVVSADPNVDITIPLYTINKRDDIEAGANFVRGTDQPAAVLWTGKCSDDLPFTARAVAEQGVPVFRDALGCLRAVRAAMDYSEFLNRADETPGMPDRPVDMDRSTARKVLREAGGTVLGEVGSRAVIEAYGLPSLTTRLARSRTEAGTIVEEFGAAVVMKIDSPDIPHKTEAGGVRLNIRTRPDAKAAYAEIVAAAREYAPDADIRGVLVQKMASPGIELVLGATVDATFGPVVTVGLGGIHVEVLKDVTHRVAPVSVDEATRMLRELRAYPLLEGVRGAAASDVHAVAEMIHRLSWLIHECREDIAELDINPLMVHAAGEGADVLDALIIRPSDG